MAEGMTFSTEHKVVRKPVKYMIKAFVVSRGNKKEKKKVRNSF